MGEIKYTVMEMKIRNKVKVHRYKESKQTNKKENGR